MLTHPVVFLFNWSLSLSIHSVTNLISSKCNFPTITKFKVKLVFVTAGRTSAQCEINHTFLSEPSMTSGDPYNYHFPVSYRQAIPTGTNVSVYMTVEHTKPITRGRWGPSYAVGTYFVIGLSYCLIRTLNLNIECPHIHRSSFLYLEHCSICRLFPCN